MLSIHGFRIVATFILMVFVILLENDDVFKLLVYLDIYLFIYLGILPTQSVEVSLLRTLNL